ncbi:helix-turn-helix domain-containing protein [Streptomyces showdoensis]|uniref:helix-turn-helix domain-containing protein n=2 Tax=Streptomyces TaxID=1883 RepID=UPI0013F4C227|nr:helix-turn-helix transcriptional regulator [Streptomyces showdoensis]
MDSIEQLTDHERATVVLQAEQAELGHQAYALGLELLAQGRRDEAKNWLSTAARYHVSGALEELDRDGARAAAAPAASVIPPLPTGRHLAPLDRDGARAAAAPTASATPRLPASRRLAPAAQRILLGARLRELRENRGITQTEAALRVHASTATVSRFEHGQPVPGSADKLERLLDLYEVHDPWERNRLLDTLNAAQGESWWHEYNDITPERLRLLFDLEQSADSIQTYEARLVPGLLQTPKYAREILRTGLPLDEEETIDRRVELRMKRQQLLDSIHAPKLHAVLDEGVLLRQVGSRRVMQEQLEHLLRLARWPNVTIQIVPFRAGGVVDIGEPVTILRFAERLLPDIVYTEQLSGAQYISRGDAHSRYQEQLYRLADAAERPHNTESIVHAILGHAETLREAQVRGPDAAVYNGFMERVATEAAPPDLTSGILRDLIASCG